MTILTDKQYRDIAPDRTSLWNDVRGVSFSQGWLDAKGVQTRYLHSGDKDLPVLILLHGVGGHAEAYMRNLGSHGRHFSTYAIDMIGHGWTSKPDLDLEIDQYIDHLSNVIDAIGVERVHLSGESLGGWVGAKFAARYPEKINKLVLNTMGGSKANPVVMERLKTLSMQAATAPTWDFLQARVQWLMFDKADATDDLVACRQAIYQQPGMAAMMEHIIVLQDMTTRLRNLITDQEFADIQAETLVLWTSHDPTAGVDEGQKIASKIKNARFEVMQDCGHWPQWEDTETFDKIHIGFLTQ